MRTTALPQQSPAETSFPVSFARSVVGKDPRALARATGKDGQPGTFIVEQITIRQLAELVAVRGWAFAIGDHHQQHPSNTHVRRVQLIGFDFDGGPGVPDLLACPAFEDLLRFAYTTQSRTPENERARVVLFFDEPIDTGDQSYNPVISGLVARRYKALAQRMMLRLLAYAWSIDAEKAGQPFDEALALEWQREQKKSGNYRPYVPDPACLSAAQRFFGSPNAIWDIVDGTLVSVRDLGAELAEEAQVEDWERDERQNTVAVPLSGNGLQDAYNKAIADAFNVLASAHEGHYNEPAHRAGVLLGRLAEHPSYEGAQLANTAHSIIEQFGDDRRNHWRSFEGGMKWGKDHPRVWTRQVPKQTAGSDSRPRSAAANGTDSAPPTRSADRNIPEAHAVQTVAGSRLMLCTQAEYDREYANVIAVLGAPVASTVPERCEPDAQPIGNILDLEVACEIMNGWRHDRAVRVLTAFCRLWQDGRTEWTAQQIADVTNESPSRVYDIYWPLFRKSSRFRDMAGSKYIASIPATSRNHMMVWPRRAKSPVRRLPTPRELKAILAARRGVVTNPVAQDETYFRTALAGEDAAVEHCGPAARRLHRSPDAKVARDRARKKQTAATWVLRKLRGIAFVVDPDGDVAGQYWCAVTNAVDPGETGNLGANRDQVAFLLGVSHTNVNAALERVGRGAVPRVQHIHTTGEEAKEGAIFTCGAYTRNLRVDGAFWARPTEDIPDDAVVTVDLFFSNLYLPKSDPRAKEAATARALKQVTRKAKRGVKGKPPRLHWLERLARGVRPSVDWERGNIPDMARALAAPPTRLMPAARVEPPTFDELPPLEDEYTKWDATPAALSAAETASPMPATSPWRRRNIPGFDPFPLLKDLTAPAGMD